MGKKAIVVFSICVVLSFLSKGIFAADEIEVAKALHRTESSSPSSEVVKSWLDRIELSVVYETDQKPTFYFQTVQPLYQSIDKINTWFIQPRVNYQNTEVTYNAGIGYRYLKGNDWILGANLFGDYQDKHHHGRVGLGFEAISQILEGRLNSYFGITPKRVVEESTSTTTLEKAADGGDLELGIPVPYLPWLKIYGSGFWYNFEKFADKYGWKGRIEARLNEAVALEGFAWDDNKGTREYGGRVRINLKFDSLRDFTKLLEFASDAFPRKDMSKQTLIPVERNFNIVVESWAENKTGGLTFEIHRGD